MDFLKTWIVITFDAVSAYFPLNSYYGPKIPTSHLCSATTMR
jgi:hypothetical protein